MKTSTAGNYIARLTVTDGTYTSNADFNVTFVGN
jgi:hypothetical protein